MRFVFSTEILSSSDNQSDSWSLIYTPQTGESGRCTRKLGSLIRFGPLLLEGVAYLSPGSETEHGATISASRDLPLLPTNTISKKRVHSLLDAIADARSWAENSYVERARSLREAQ